jgi:hypothetical protein
MSLGLAAHIAFLRKPGDGCVSKSPPRAIKLNASLPGSAKSLWFTGSLVSATMAGGRAFDRF